MGIMRMVGFALALGTAAAANVQEAGHGAGAPPFAELDTDQNGYLTETEASKVPAVAEVFAELDAEEYGRIAEIH